ncbi:hypothetical protein CANARDRAFT_194618 [[Candida] arabinofermentans NRRL YB-2248]|uniref:NADP-dependent oxidoreductase domain-containing protein n=1 Tax=[Candida] arabinofermentans NRRL YB-2248 TaxID=983967 RepID=A0A1E4T797_9ASCO|nr:hypothetical protein CANARDRAFT_194618 [[Candida] arabinofermentans NRRL YB-2248]
MDGLNWEKVPQKVYTRVGASGLQISKVIVGCMSFGNKKWQDWVIEDEEEVFAILKKAYDAGLRTYDTADVYSNGTSEVLLGKFLKKYNIPRETVVILSKCFFTHDPERQDYTYANEKNFDGHEYINRRGLSRKHILASVKASTERLGTYIDLYQIHRFDKATPIEETMKALHDCIEKDYVRYIGASSMTTYNFVMMQNVAEKYGWTKFISMQNYYNLLYREEEKEMNEYCKLTGVGILPWSPNATGYLARPLSVTVGETSRAENKRFSEFLGYTNMSDNDKKIVNRVEELSKKYKVSMASIATAWSIAKGGCPIVGFSKPERIDDALVAIKLELSEEDIKYLEEPYDPHWIPYLNAPA